MSKIDVPNHIENRIKELVDAKAQVLARLTAIEGAIMELNKLKVDLEAPVKPKKEELKKKDAA